MSLWDFNARWVTAKEQSFRTSNVDDLYFCVNPNNHFFWRRHDDRPSQEAGLSPELQVLFESMNKPTSDFFTEEMAQRYDERNSQLAPIADNMHFLIRLILKDLPARSRILCVGAGTGAEILSLAKAFPDWSFVALDPSQAMLDVCRQRIEQVGISNRCEFVHGYIQDLPIQGKFDAALSILVAHFIKPEERLDFFRQVTGRLRNGGYLVNAEISFDLNSPEFPMMLKGWEGVQTMMGATPDTLKTLPKMLKDVLTVLPPEETENLIRQSGIGLPIRFFQALMICGWYGIKEPTS